MNKGVGIRNLNGLWRIRVRVTLQWRHNLCDDVSNLPLLDCLLNRLFRSRTSKLRVTGLCEESSPVMSLWVDGHDLGEVLLILLYWYRANIRSTFETINTHCVDINVMGERQEGVDKVHHLTHIFHSVRSACSALSCCSNKWRGIIRRYQMETFYSLLALCAGNSPVTGEFPSQWPVTRSFNVCFDLRLVNDGINNRETGYFRHHRAHYDVPIMNGEL